MFIQLRTTDGDERPVVRVKLRERPVDVDVRVLPADTGGPNRNTRAYVDTSETFADREFVRPLYPRDADGTIRYTERGDDPDADRAFDRGNREQAKIWRETLSAVAAVWDTEVDAKFSRDAGCSCGCSPGFIVKNIRDDRNRPLEVFLTAHDVTDVDVAPRSAGQHDVLSADREPFASRSDDADADES